MTSNNYITKHCSLSPLFSSFVQEPKCITAFGGGVCGKGMWEGCVGEGKGVWVRGRLCGWGEGAGKNIYSFVEISPPCYLCLQHGKDRLPLELSYTTVWSLSSIFHRCGSMTIKASLVMGSPDLSPVEVWQGHQVINEKSQVSLYSILRNFLDLFRYRT